MRLTFLLITLLSCSPIEHERETKSNLRKHWLVIEQASAENWTEEQIIKILGLPESKNEKSPASWIYLNPRTKFQEWSINFDGQKKVSSVDYLPSWDSKEEFSIKKILERWANLNCRTKRKQVLKGHLVRNLEFIDCNQGDRIIRYNKYREVSSIFVKN